MFALFEEVELSKDLQYKKKTLDLCVTMNQQVPPPFEIVLIKEEIADNLQDGDVLEEEESIEKKDKFSALQNPENINVNMQYSSSLCKERHIENFLLRVKKETGFNLIHEEIQIKEERLFEVIDSDSEDKSNNKLQNEGMVKTDCNSTFSEGGKNMRMDQKVNHAKRLKCNERHKEFSKHNRIHTGERLFKCTICEKTFSSSDLSRHLRTHTGEKPYKCDVCNKTFTTKSQLIVHKRTHNNERLFKCPVCEKTFTQCGHLSRHMRIHTGEKPFDCQICHNKFAQATNLKTHMRIHTGEKPFTCKHCQRAFNNSCNLKSHMRTQHTDKI